MKYVVEKKLLKGRKKTIFKNKFNRNTFAQRQSFIEKTLLVIPPNKFFIVEKSTISVLIFLLEMSF